MSRGIGQSVITELAKDAFEMAHIITIDFSNKVYLTNHAHDISYGSNTYSASAHILQISDANEVTGPNASTFTLNLSGVQQSFISILLSENYVDREVVVDMVVLDSSGSVIGQPINIHNGRIDGFSIKDDNSTSQINLSVASHWADFSKQSGRRTNHASQQIHFAGDQGFEFAASTVKDIKWGRA